MMQPRHMLSLIHAAADIAGENYQKEGKDELVQCVELINNAVVGGQGIKRILKFHTDIQKVWRQSVREYTEKDARQVLR